jgi:hypothetical protein
MPNVTVRCCDWCKRDNVELADGFCSACNKRSDEISRPRRGRISKESDATRILKSAATRERWRHRRERRKEYELRRHEQRKQRRREKRLAAVAKVQTFTPKKTRPATRSGRKFEKGE